MTRLHTEFSRLYQPNPASDSKALIDSQGRVRALVLELRLPAQWEPLAGVWRGVQTDLGWPAPAIAASGVQGLQLWFSLAQPQEATSAHAVLLGLSRRYLAGVPAQCVQLWPTLHAEHARPVPALTEASGNWSAFVAPDLAPLFAPSPWLDLPPGDDGQAQLLAGLGSISPELWHAAVEQLQVTRSVPDSPATPPASHGLAPAPTSLSASSSYSNPQDFLLAVMNDASVPLALRLEAAKALLPVRAGGHPPDPR